MSSTRGERNYTPPPGLCSSSVSQPPHAYMHTHMHTHTCPHMRLLLLVLLLLSSCPPLPPTPPPSYHPFLLSPFSPQPSRSLYVIVRVIDRGVSLSSPLFLPSSFRIQCHWLQSTSLENTSELYRKMLKPLTRWELILTTNTLADTLACAVIGVTLCS